MIQWLEPNGRSPAAHPTVSLWRDGRIGLNAAAKELLGAEAVRVGFDPAQNRVYLAPANGDARGAFRIHPYKGGRSGYISGTALIARFDPVAPYRGELRRDDDGLYLQLPPRPGRE